MQVGQKFGPFVIEKELGAGAMGAVYRALFTQTGQRVAIKIMAPGLGQNNPTAVARFEREAAILKQLKHPNIVRLFGVGKYQGTRYYAMEFVDGDSLDRVMARRDRMTWEEVAEMGQKLCAALQHAHEKGVIHRDLKPSNLMILPDGTLKLTDFGIAKDLDVTALTSANCTVGTASYMSPEQCRGERDLTNKSDLYSMGVVFYELITGRKPFVAENAMDMFLLHVQAEPVRPSKYVLDLPVWMDNLICQLLEKQPARRPFDAAMVSRALGDIREKVEAQKSAGVVAVNSRIVDRPHGQRNPDAEDREAARSLRRGKKPRRKTKERQFYERGWFQAVGLATLLGAVALVLYLVFSPPSPDTLYARAEKLMRDPNKWDRARREPIHEYLHHYRGRPGAQTAKMLRWANEIDARDKDALVQRHVKTKRKNSPLQVQANDDTEKLAFKAADAEETGDAVDARKKWQNLQDREKDSPWGVVAEQHLAALDEVGKREAQLKTALKSTLEEGVEPKAEGLEGEAALALRYEQFGDLVRAQQHFQRIRKEYLEEENAANRVWYLLAVQKIAALKAKLDDGKPDRIKLVEKAVDEAKKNVDIPGTARQVRTLCMNVIALYGKENDPDADKLTPLVKSARETWKKLPEAFRPK